MKNLLINELNKFGYPVFLQGSLNADEAYPETFITFFTDYTADGSHYENDVNSVEWNFSVILYSSDPKIVNEKPIEIINALKKAGFIHTDLIKKDIRFGEEKEAKQLIITKEMYFNK